MICDNGGMGVMTYLLSDHDNLSSEEGSSVPANSEHLRDCLPERPISLHTHLNLLLLVGNETVPSSLELRVPEPQHGLVSRRESSLWREIFVAAECRAHEPAG